VNIIDLVRDGEKNPIYEAMAVANLRRQYSFLQSLVQASIALNRDMLSFEVIRALNFHALSCLHETAGEFRRCEVKVGKHEPPEANRVLGLVHMFVDEVNRMWGERDEIFIAAFVLWKLNYIHPFVNGNGRTARAACYFVLCLKMGRWLDGAPILPELITQNHGKYIQALEYATQKYEGEKADEEGLEGADQGHPLGPLHALLTKLNRQQRESADLLALPKISARPALPVKNLAAARRFYEGSLGFGKPRPGSGEFVTYESEGNATFSLYRSDGAGGTAALTWMVGERLEDMQRMLAEKGVEFEHDEVAGMRREGNIYIDGDHKVARFKDPDGNLLSLSNKQ
jgi:fido (protein-threonine AMPylation protein)/catechol 2,3-dioxygenase-like lactoylglutathione lyase family enzyme